MTRVISVFNMALLAFAYQISKEKEDEMEMIYPPDYDLVSLQGDIDLSKTNNTF